MLRGTFALSYAAQRPHPIVREGGEWHLGVMRSILRVDRATATLAAACLGVVVLLGTFTYIVSEATAQGQVRYAPAQVDASKAGPVRKTANVARP
jgi:hypothetical protein